MLTQNIKQLDAVIEPLLHAARIPGAAIAVVADGETVFAKGYGLRDLEAHLPVTPETVYPIGSTTKAINATLLGMLVDEGRLAWDAPVQNYLPLFSLQDPMISPKVTVRDLITMRTGLPRHDWLWIENPISRADLVERLRYLELTAGFRERLQYNNLTVTAAGHIAEIITGHSWEHLVREKILEPLGMTNTGFASPREGNLSLSYHENSRRELKLSRRFASEVTAPSGGSIHSTVEDMARWLLFNLNEGKVKGRQLINPRTIAEIHASQMIVKGAEPSAPSHTYAMGWSVDTYNGCRCVYHSGYVHDVDSEVMLFPEKNVGLVSFTNFGGPTLAKCIDQHAFDCLMGFKPVENLEGKLAEYEAQIVKTCHRNASTHRIENTSPSHPLDNYAGIYVHKGYGKIELICNQYELIFRRNQLILPLDHWHYDAWIAKDAELFLIHEAHAFDRTSRFVFDTNANGAICAVSIPLEPAAAPIRFEKESPVVGG